MTIFTPLQNAIRDVKSRTEKGLFFAIVDSRSVHDALINIINHYINNFSDAERPKAFYFHFACERKPVAKALDVIRDDLVAQLTEEGGDPADIPKFSFAKPKKTVQVKAKPVKKAKSAKPAPKTITTSAIKVEAEKEGTSVEAITTSHKNAGHKIIDDTSVVNEKEEAPKTKKVPTKAEEKVLEEA